MKILINKSLIILSLMYSSLTISQEQPNPIEALEFLTGHWEGPGVSYLEDGKTQDFHDIENVRFDLDANLLLINAKGLIDGELLYQLHTVIYYDHEAGHYFYTPFRGKKKPVPSKCQLKKQQFKCMNINNDARLTFQRLPDGGWNEYGEKLIDGQWQKYFETKLYPKDMN